MNVVQLLNELADQGIRLAVEGEQLRVRAPKGTLTAQHKVWLAEQRDALLALLRDERREGLPRLSPRPDQRHEPFPLTDIQQAYWVGRMGAFNQGDISIHLYVEIDCEALDVGRLEAAWNQMIGRHDMLRSVIQPDGQQRILEHVPEYRFVQADLRDVAPSAAAERLEALRETMAHQVLPTDRWPGFDIRVSRLDERRTRLHVSIDLVHIDGGSVMMLLTEWVSLYHDLAISLPPITISYRDYVLAEAALQQSPSYQTSLEYWRQRVEQLPPAPELPLATSPGALARTRFVHRTAKIPDEIWSRVKLRAAELDLTSAAVLASVYADVLAAWSRRPSFTLNVTVFNRMPLHPEVDRILGDFTSMILLGVDGAAGRSFAARTRAIQQQLWADLEHHEVSGVRVVRELARVRRQYDGAVMPIVFTNMLNLRSKGFSSLYTALERLGEVAFTVMMTPQVWVDYQVHEDAEGLRLTWDTVEDLFPPGMQDAMLAAYREQLERLADDPASWEADHLGLVPSADLVLYDEVNATDAPVPEVLLHELVAEHVARHPEHPAVITSERTLSYGELWAQACRLGQRLRQLGVLPDRLVAVVMEKGWEQVVAVLGIHLAGAAYLPIDPGVPAERLVHLLEHGQAAIAITQRGLDDALAWPAGVRRLTVDAPEVLACEPTMPPAAQRPYHLAYVLYTSGSTGQPKGVMIEQRSVVNRMLDVNRRIAAGPGDRVLALSALHHDLSVYDVLGILVAGGAAVMPDASALRDPAHWAAMMAEHGVTLWNSVPMFLEMLVEHLEHAPAGAPRPERLRLAILAGDWIGVRLPDRVRALLPGCAVIASGGPTETTIWDIWYPVGEVGPGWTSIPYGKPMANTRYHVLDHALRPRPVWVPGELYIAGEGLARGYWRDPERTAASFVIDPRTGERLYRSGDCGRWLPDGTIEFLGRVEGDGQVKVGGHRIELGEIEAALLQHPDVSQAVVVATGEPPGPRQLVAHVVAGRGDAHDTAETPDAPPAGNGELTDPAERLAFKLSHRNLRADLEGRAGVELPRIEVDEALRRAYEQRRSRRRFSPEPVALEALGALLAALVGLPRDGWPRYRYASAGGLYPVQAYVYVVPGRVTGLRGGTYYHHPLEHRLVELDPDARIDESAHSINNRAAAASSAFSIFLVGQLRAIEPLYGALARDFCLLEAGYASQLLMSEAHGHGLGLCPIGGVALDGLGAALRLDDGHVLLHCHVGGRLPEDGGHDAEAAPRRPLAVELRELLRRKLPAPLVPAAIVTHERLPLTSNGKVDRKALVAEGAARAAVASAGGTAPRGALERTIAAIVGEVLGIERLDVGTSFFELGGTSIHIVTIARRVREALQRELPITEMFRNPTVSALAGLLGGEASGPDVLDVAQERAQARRAARRRSQEVT